MSFARLEPKDACRRISRWHPYSGPLPAGPHPSESACTSSVPVNIEAFLRRRNAVLSAPRTPRCVLATPSAPPELVPIVHAEHGLPALRRDLVNTVLSEQEKLKCAPRLFECAMNILSSAWKIVETGPFPIASTAHGDGVSTPMNVNPCDGAPQPSPYDGSQYPYQSTSEHMPLRQFVHDLLRRSCTNFLTLQIALCYVEAAAARLPALVKEEAGLMLKRARPGYISRPNDENPEDPVLPSPLLCSRRTFLASILLAAKFLQDRSYANSSWAKLTGLSAREVGRCERALCAALDYRLWPGENSEPIPAINGLDTMSVIDISMTYQPEPAPAEHLPLPSFKTLLLSLPSASAIDEPAADLLVRGDNAQMQQLSPVPLHAANTLQSSCSQSRGAYPDNASSHISPGLSYTQSTPPGSVSSFHSSTATDVDAGPQGHNDKGYWVLPP